PCRGGLAQREDRVDRRAVAHRSQVFRADRCALTHPTAGLEEGRREQHDGKTSEDDASRQSTSEQLRIVVTQGPFEHDEGNQKNDQWKLAGMYGGGSKQRQGRGDERDNRS